MDGLHGLLSQRLFQGRAPDPGALAAQLHVPADGTAQGAVPRRSGALSARSWWRMISSAPAARTASFRRTPPTASSCPGTPAPLLALRGQGAGKAAWGKTAFKYMSNRTGEKILFDCKESALTADEKSRAERFLQVLLQTQPPAVTDRPGSPAPSQRLSSSPLSDKRGF